MKNVETICGDLDMLDASPLPAFSIEARSFMERLSRKLLNSSSCRVYPDLAAVAFWARKANVEKLRQPSFANRLGWGLCFHVAPGNIPLNFAFSFLFSLLAGNANIVRLPGKAFPQSDLLCELISDLLPDFPEINARTALIRYPRDNEITAAFSLMADARMIWGGDKTIQSIRSLPVRPSCVDLCFPDRFSFAVINGEAILMADAPEMERLAANFYNDVFLMDQNACSSPRLVAWVNDSDKARQKFWNVVRKKACQEYELAAESVVDKFTLACGDCVDRENLSFCEAPDNFVFHAEVSSLSPQLMENYGKCGYFYEYSLNRISELLPICGKKCQTIIYYGVDAGDLRDFLISSHAMGVDRIVPIGKALDINATWDGINILTSLSREICIES